MAGSAERVVAAAAGQAGVQIRDLHDHADMPAVSRLVDDVWGRGAGSGSLMPAEVLTAMAHAGNQVSGAYRDDRLVAATAAFVGLDADGLFLHSHITGVLPSETGRGVGQALKWHQRAWCLARSIGRVQWTFDPLVRRNAAFNLIVLGARAVRYREDVYGPLDDALNAGQPTDRLVAEWDLSAARVEAAARGRQAEPDVGALRRAGAVEVVGAGAGDAPEVAAGPPGDAGGRPRLVQVPADIEAIRTRDPDAAAAWSRAVRDVLGGALGAGFQVSGFTRDGWYVLTASGAVRELAEEH